MTYLSRFLTCTVFDVIVLTVYCTYRYTVSLCTRTSPQIKQFTQLVTFSITVLITCGMTVSKQIQGWMWKSCISFLIQ